nr:MAG TPA_asm: hypothetical protein [Caudoviricetes sp.]
MAMGIYVSIRNLVIVLLDLKQKNIIEELGH